MVSCVFYSHFASLRLSVLFIIIVIVVMMVSNEWSGTRLCIRQCMCLCCLCVLALVHGKRFACFLFLAHVKIRVYRSCASFGLWHCICMCSTCMRMYRQHDIFGFECAQLFCAVLGSVWTMFHFLSLLQNNVHIHLHRSLCVCECVRVSYAPKWDGKH